MRTITNETWRNLLIRERVNKTGASPARVAEDFASCELIVEARLWSLFLQPLLWSDYSSSDVPECVSEDIEAVWIGARFGLPNGSITWNSVACVLECPVDRVGIRLVERWRRQVAHEFGRLLSVHRTCRAGW